MSQLLKSDLLSSVPVAFAQHPMGGDVWRDVRSEGSSLAEIVASVPNLPIWFEDYGSVCVAGTPVPKHYWSRRPGECTARLIPKVKAEDPVWVTLHIAPQGGGKDVKNVISVVAAVALIAVGAFITGGGLAGLGGLLPGLFGPGTTSAFLLAAGVTTVGRLALTLLSPPAARDKSNTSAPVLGSAGASGNQLQPGGAIPRVLGTLKIYPPFAAFPLVELNGDDETVEAAYVLAGPHQISNIRVEGTRIEDISGVQYYVENGLARSVTSILGRYGVQRTPNFELQGHRYDNDTPRRLRHQSTPESDLPTERVEVTATDPDEVWLQLTWPAGHTDTATNVSLVAPFRLRMRILGTSTWINLPELQFCNDKAGAITKKIVLKWGAAPSPIVDAADIHGAWQSFHTVPGQTISAPLGVGAWSAHSSFVNSATINDVARVVRAYDGFTVYLDPAVFPRGNRWEVGITKGASFKRVDFTPATYVYFAPSDIGSFFWYQMISGFASDQFNRTATTVDRVVLSRIASVKNSNPLPVPGNASIEIRARAVQVAQLSCEASALMADWTGSEWSGLTISSNPGTQLAHVLMGPFTDDPPDIRAINFDELAAFRQRCIDMDYQSALSVDGQDWWETLQSIASCGFGRLRAGTRYGVAFDRDSSLETGQHFSSRNAASVTLEKAFIPLEDAFRVTFRNRLTDWADEEVMVIRPGLSKADVKRVTVVNAVGLDRSAAVQARFLYDLKSQDLRDYTVSFDVPPEGLVSQMGDLVELTHPVLSRHHFAARIASVILDGGGMCTGLALDNRHQEGSSTSLASVPDIAVLADLAEQGVSLAATIVRADWSEVTATIAQSGLVTDTITFASPISASGLARQQLVVIGEASMVTERLIIKNVRGTRRFLMRITAVPEAPGLWS